MGIPPRISGAFTALVIATGACADVPDSPTAPASTNAVQVKLNMKAMAISSSAIGEEATRLAGMVEDSHQRADLRTALDRLSRAMDAGDADNARRALSDAREGLRFMGSDADRDALSLVLDAAEESLSSPLTHGATR